VAARNRFLKGKRVLITAGPTWVPIDGVRVISNLSSGAMGRALARTFARAGARVTLLEGPVPNAADIPGIRTIKFSFYDELGRRLKQELKKPYCCVVHAAAVADYRLSKPSRGKLPSGKKRLNLKLVPTQKLINKIKRWRPACCLVGFKLLPAGQSRMVRAQACRLRKESGCDLIIANVLKPRYQAWLLDSKENVLARADARPGIAKKLIHTLKERL